MQGFVLHTQRVKDEDLIVFILSKKAIFKTYRFYGLRHSSILTGYKIDFALEENSRFLPRLKDVLHIGFYWLFQREKMLIWQDFIRLLYKHLNGVESIDNFYFELLNECVKKFDKQNPKRIIIDAYVRILEHEGRLHKKFTCFVCDEKITQNIVLVRAFLPAHYECIQSYGFNKDKLKEFYESKNSSVFDDDEINELYALIKEGL
ncbi:MULTISPECIES: recombination protein RecO [unclassified Campylobacter]|uniref:recombination protein RecO n=1 Tax=unclassified Campylobacter TaxID=2593542 RepID=UPI0012380BD1|nr:MULTISPECIES: recombination protein RecO [unclassified Campylobacter]KAA6225172.1 recombination protein RecO [Campylobacter sp. LR196d]KAA6226184.1 recombination protein RecO [Campylobacter sp. LR185c]KAA6229016.1 recombination protein RecO [Campylobacter sp. LR286c]KAA6231385.1 recombination protein RecO [Campylobacter sp. LR264d]KAA6231597.1 recombination protein RecO [Campylobacter sp. LR291e]